MTRARGARRSDRVAAAATAVAFAVVFGFVLVTIVAIVVRVPPRDLLRALRSRVALHALLVSLRASAIAVGAIVVLGTPVAYVLGTRRFRGAAALSTVLELPLVLPPAVAGIGLFAAFGRFGLLGGALRAFGVTIPFTQGAVVMALAFVAMPFYTRQAVAAFASMDASLLGAARTLGSGSARTFVRVALPLARPGLSAGIGLAWARALGEFGATILFAGSLQGRTQTLPLAIYEQFGSGDLRGALAMSSLLLAVSAALLLVVRAAASRGGGSREEGTWPATWPSRSTTG